MPILFLDFDGVLHPEHCHESRHFCSLPIMEEALRQVPECRVVITSTWRLEQPYEALRKLCKTLPQVWLESASAGIL